jgi:GNAT superfamily N-acetyltransferase
MLASYGTGADSARVSGSEAIAWRLRDAVDEDLDWVIQRHAALYREEQSWDDRFAAIVARVVAEFRARRSVHGERGFVAEQCGQRLGCAFVMRDEEAADAAKLRLLLVEPAARRRGIGKHLIDACVEFAQSSGYRTLSLWTESVLADARRLYQRKGFRRIRVEAHASFGSDLSAETWELTL